MKQRQSQQGAIAALRGRAAGLAALLAVAQAAGLAHQLVADHRTCEHGQIVEAGAALSHEAVEPDAAHLLAPEGERAEGEHVHCLAVALQRQAAERAATPLLAAPPRLAHATLVRDVAPVVLPREVLLLLAPKASPPA